VPHRQERTHQSAEQQEPRQQQERDHLGFVSARRQTAKEQDDGVGHDGREQPRAFLLVAVRSADAGVSGRGERGGSPDPHRHLQSVTPRALTDEGAECRHRDASVGAGL
jgi:hypothetical protein